MRKESGSRLFHVIVVMGCTLGGCAREPAGASGSRVTSGDLARRDMAIVFPELDLAAMPVPPISAPECAADGGGDASCPDLWLEFPHITG